MRLVEGGARQLSFVAIVLVGEKCARAWMRVNQCGDEVTVLCQAKQPHEPLR